MNGLKFETNKATSPKHVYNDSTKERNYKNKSYPNRNGFYPFLKNDYLECDKQLLCID